MPSKRRLVREHTLKALYAHEISGDPAEHVINNVFVDLKDKKESYAFAQTLFLKTLEKHDEVDGIIQKRVANWEFDRIALIDKLLLRMAICELLFFEDIPPKVTINEAIEIAKRYSTEKSGKFVNGILDAVLEDLKKSNSLKKTGRGLIETTLSPPDTQEQKKNK